MVLGRVYLFGLDHSEGTSRVFVVVRVGLLDKLDGLGLLDIVVPTCGIVAMLSVHVCM